MELVTRQPEIGIDTGPLASRLDRLEEELSAEAAEAATYEMILRRLDRLPEEAQWLEQVWLEIPDPQDEEDQSTLQERLYLTRRRFVTLLARDVASDPDLAFDALESYDDFDVDRIKRHIHQRLIEWFNEKLPGWVATGYRKKLQERIAKDKGLITGIGTFAITYFKDYPERFFGDLGDRFFDLIAEEQADKRPLLDAMLQGTRKYVPIFDTDNGLITHRLDQVAMRVKEARKRQQKLLEATDEELKEAREKLKRLEVENSAMERAAEITEGAVQRYDIQRFVDSIAQEGKEWKILGWMEAEKLRRLLSRIEAQSRAHPESEAIHEALRLITRFINENQEGGLALRQETLRTERERNLAKVAELEGRKDDERQKGWELYDKDLYRMKEAFVENLGRLRKTET